MTRRTKNNSKHAAATRQPTLGTGRLGRFQLELVVLLSLVVCVGIVLTLQPIGNTPHRLSFGVEVSSPTYAWLSWFRAAVLVVTVCYLFQQLRLSRSLKSRVRAVSPMFLDLDNQTVEQMIQKRQAIRDFLSHDWSTLMNAEFKVSDLMSRELISVLPDDIAADAWQRMQKLGIHQMLVVDSRGQLQGILRYCGDEDGNDLLLVKDVMNVNTIATSPEARVSAAISLMLRYRLDAIPVCHNDRPVGMITTTDLMSTLQCTLKLLSEISSTLKGDREANGQIPDEVEFESPTPEAANTSKNAESIFS